MTPTKPEDVFRAEKERALSVRNSQHARLLAEAKAAFDKLMAEGQAARKSGRPRKHPLPPLKTSSARPPAKPEFLVSTPIAKAPTLAVVSPTAPTPAKSAKPHRAEVRPGTAKSAPNAKRARHAAPKKGAKAAAKSKPKAKRSTKR